MILNALAMVHQRVILFEKEKQYNFVRFAVYFNRTLSVKIPKLDIIENILILHDCHKY